MGLIYPTDKGPLHVHNVFQGIMVQGGAGAGKSASIIEPAIKQWVDQNMSMTIYDFKGNPPTLGRMAYNAWLQTKESINSDTELRDIFNAAIDHLQTMSDILQHNTDILDNDDIEYHLIHNLPQEEFSFKEVLDILTKEYTKKNLSPKAAVDSVINNQKLLNKVIDEESFNDIADFNNLLKNDI